MHTHSDGAHRANSISISKIDEVYALFVTFIFVWRCEQDELDMWSSTVNTIYVYTNKFMLAFVLGFVTRIPRMWNMQRLWFKLKQPILYRRSIYRSNIYDNLRFVHSENYRIQKRVYE